MPLAPAGLLVETDAECGLPHHFVRENSVGRVNPAEARIAQQSLVSGRAKDAPSAGDIEAKIYNAPRCLDGPILRREDLERPFVAVIDAAGPVLGDPFDVRPDGL